VTVLRIAWLMLRRPMTDEELVRRTLAGDPGAYARLVDRHYDRCARYAYRMLGTREDAEDAVQETFLRAYRALARYEARDAFGGWLARILVNQCRTLAARRARIARRFVRDDDALARAEAPGWVPEGGGVDDALQRALAGLEPLLREAFLLKHVEDMSYERMEQATGAGRSALKMRVKRACDALRAALEVTEHA
jgi:RNA polymerase sigma-70 factor (ECF subfamily)